MLPIRVQKSIIMFVRDIASFFIVSVRRAFRAVLFPSGGCSSPLYSHTVLYQVCYRLTVNVELFKWIPLHLINFPVEIKMNISCKYYKKMTTNKKLTPLIRCAQRGGKKQQQKKQTTKHKKKPTV